ncbi:putative GPI-anchor transamidase isoform X2 [Armigeres subalbatus]
MCGAQICGRTGNVKNGRRCIRIKGNNRNNTKITPPSICWWAKKKYEFKMQTKDYYTKIVVFLAVFIILLKNNRCTANEIELPKQFVASSSHTNNWAVLVDTSRFWFNYRHIANVLSVYRSVKRLGIPDSQILLMIADDMACNPRNPRPATVFNNANQHINVYGADVEVDYRGYEVTVENFVRLLTGRNENGTARSKRLLSDAGSNVLIYLTGHGGDGFLKFQDSEEITNQELADAIEQMWQKQRYNELFFMIDTCQAASMYEKFYSPNILAVASSLVGEDSLSHHVDPAIGVYIIDRYTYYALEFLEKVEVNSKKTMGEFLSVCPKRVCISTVGVRKDLYPKDPYKVPITDFFGSIRPTEITSNVLNVTLSTIPEDRFEAKAISKPNPALFYEQFPSSLFV